MTSSGMNNITIRPDFQIANRNMFACLSTAFAFATFLTSILRDIAMSVVDELPKTVDSV